MQTPPRIRLRPGENYLVNWRMIRDTDMNLFNIPLTVDNEGNPIYVNVYDDVDGYDYAIDPNIMGINTFFYFTRNDISTDAGIVETLNLFRMFIGLGNVSFQNIYTPP